MKEIVINAQGETRQVDAPYVPEVPEEQQIHLPSKSKIHVGWRRVFEGIESVSQIIKDAEICQDEGEYRVKIDRPDIPWTIGLVFSDAHIGTYQSDHKLIRGLIDKIMTTPNSYLIDTGDTFNNGIWGGLQFEDVIPPYLQAFTVKDMARELGNKFAACVIGNHPEWMFNHAGIEPEYMFAENLEAPIFPGMGLLHLKAGDQEYKVAMAHTYWGKCLSGATRLFCWVDNKPGIRKLQELFFLKGSHEIFLIGDNGEKIQLKGIERSKQESVKILFVDGQEITCSANHRFVLDNGELKEAIDLNKGDILKKAHPKLNCLIKNIIWNYDWGWLIGLFLAEGSFSRETVQLSLCEDEFSYLGKINKLFKMFGIKFVLRTIQNSNGISMASSNPIAKSVIKHFVKGKHSTGKHLSYHAYLYGKDFLRGVVDGWLDGDGHYEKENKRYDAKISPNFWLRDDLRLCCSLVGYDFRARRGYTQLNGALSSCFRIKIKKKGLFRRQRNSQILKITKSKKGRNLYDVEVGGNHLFLLLNGVITHNSKLNIHNCCVRLRENEYPDADVFVVGHEHIWGFMKEMIDGKEVLYIRPGTAKTHDRYARIHGIAKRGQQMGIALMCRTDKKYFEARPIEEAISLMV